MMLGELITLRQQRLPVKVVVFNNGALSFVELEMKAAGIVTYGTDLDNPYFGLPARAWCTASCCATAVPSGTATAGSARGTRGRRAARGVAAQARSTTNIDFAANTHIIGLRRPHLWPRWRPCRCRMS